MLNFNVKLLFLLDAQSFGLGKRLIELEDVLCDLIEASDIFGDELCRLWRLS